MCQCSCSCNRSMLMTPNTSLATASVIVRYAPVGAPNTSSLSHFDLRVGVGILNSHACIHGKRFSWDSTDRGCEQCLALCRLMRANIRKRWLAGDIVRLDTEIEFLREAVEESGTSEEFALLGFS